MNLTHVVKENQERLDALEAVFDKAGEEEQAAGFLLPRLLIEHQRAMERLTAIEEHFDALAEAVNTTLDKYEAEKEAEAEEFLAAGRGEEPDVVDIDEALAEELRLRQEEAEAIAAVEGDDVPITEKMATTHTMARTLADELPKGLDAVVSGMEKAPDDLS